MPVSALVRAKSWLCLYLKLLLAFQYHNFTKIINICGLFCIFIQIHLLNSINKIIDLATQFLIIFIKKSQMNDCEYKLILRKKIKYWISGISLFVILFKYIEDLYINVVI